MRAAVVTRQRRAPCVFDLAADRVQPRRMLGHGGHSHIACPRVNGDAPGKGFHWGAEAHHADLPRGQRVEFGTVGTLREILFGPSRVADGTMNLIGALRRAMATTGYTELKEFQRIEVVVQ